VLVSLFPAANGKVRLGPLLENERTDPDQQSRALQSSVVAPFLEVELRHTFPFLTDFYASVRLKSRELKSREPSPSPQISLKRYSSVSALLPRFFCRGSTDGEYLFEEPYSLHLTTRFFSISTSLFLRNPALEIPGFAGKIVFYHRLLSRSLPLLFSSLTCGPYLRDNTNQTPHAAACFFYGSVAPLSRLSPFGVPFLGADGRINPRVIPFFFRSP